MQVKAAAKAAKRLGNFTRLVELHWSEARQQFLDFGNHSQDVTLQVKCAPKSQSRTRALTRTVAEGYPTVKIYTEPLWSRQTLWWSWFCQVSSSCVQWALEHNEYGQPIRRVLRRVVATPPEPRYVPQFGCAPAPCLCLELAGSLQKPELE